MINTPERALWTGKRLDRGVARVLNEDSVTGYYLLQTGVVTYDDNDKEVISNKHYIITGIGGIERSIMVNGHVTAVEVDPATVEPVAVKVKNSNKLPDGIVGECPNCNHAVCLSTVGKQNGYSQYCDSCGQRLEWEEL